MSVRSLGAAALVVAAVGWLVTVVVLGCWWGRPPAALGTVGDALLLVGLALLAISWVGVARQHVFRRMSRSRGLDRADRRRILAEVRGRRPVDDGDLPTAVLVADALRAQWAMLPTYAAWFVLAAGSAMHPSRDRWSTLAIAIGVSAVLAGSVGLTVDARRADAFLARHAAPTPDRALPTG